MTMSESRSPLVARARPVIAWIAGAAAIVFVGVNFHRAQLTQRLDALNAQVTATSLTNGVSWHIEGVTETSRSGTPSSDATPRLVLVYSTDCAKCRAEREKWIARVPELAARLNAGVDIVLLQSTDDLAPLVRALTASRQPHRQFRVDNRTAFIRASGVSFTPLILFVDSADRVRFLTSELSDDAERGLAGFVPIAASR